MPRKQAKTNNSSWKVDPAKVSIIPNKTELSCAKKITDLIYKSPCNFLAIKNQVDVLTKKGYQQLEEGKKWNLKKGGKYFVTRNGSSVIAFCIPSKAKPQGFTMVNSHSDFPSLKIKSCPETNVGGVYTTLNIEIYGGPIFHTWFDTPLGVAGRAYVNTKNGIKSKPVNIDKPLVMIPSRAVHQHRDVNKGFDINPQIDMLPLFGGKDAGSLIDVIAKSIGVKTGDIVESELYCYRCEEPKFWGAHNEFVSTRSIDDQACAFGSLLGFLEAKPKNHIPVHIVFDNEEIGSGTRQGANSTFLQDVLTRVVENLGLTKEQYHQMLANSMALSADNGHALHPNRTETTDPNVRPFMGGGTLLKYSAAFNYTTDATSGAIVKKIANNNGIKLQEFFNRSDAISGSALGRFLISDVAVISADVGLAQLAMHSSYETCATRDLNEFKELTRVFFSSGLNTLKDGTYEIL